MKKNADQILTDLNSIWRVEPVEKSLEMIVKQFFVSA
jgi:hypothetical protein